MGGIKEQYAAFATLIYPAAISLFIYTTIPFRNRGTRILTATALLLINASFAYNQNLIFTSYSDAPAASLFAFITILILKDCGKNDLIKKIQVVGIMLYAFIQIKYFFFYYSFFLLSAWIFIDYRNFINYIQESGIKKFLYKLFPFFIILITIEISKYFYFHTIWPYYQLKGAAFLVEPLSTLRTYSSIDFFGDYISTALNILLNKFNWLYFIFILSIIFPFFYKQNNFNKSKLSLYLLNILVPLSVLVLYTKNQRELTNMSIVRYVSLGLFLTPLILQYYPIKLYGLVNSKIFSPIIAASIILLTLFFLITRNPVDLTFHTGRYADSSELSGYADMAEYIKSTIPAEDKIVVVNNYSGYVFDKDPNGPKDFMTNIDFDSRYLKYFLFDRNHIGAYMLTMDEFKEALKEDKVKNLAVIFDKNQDERYYEFFGVENSDKIDGLTLYIYKVLDNNGEMEFETYELTE
jgi:hypothetical protein